MRYVVARDLIDPDRFHLSELWNDIGALANHFATPHMAAFSATARDLGGSAPYLRRIHVSQLADLNPGELKSLRGAARPPAAAEEEPCPC